MTLTLDAQSEQRIQREIDLGRYSEPAEVIAHALNLLDEEEGWLLRNKEATNEHLKESYAEIERGEGIPESKVREMLAQARARRVA